MRFFWPTKLNETPGVLTRFGRVLHWIATAIFVAAGVPLLVWMGIGAYQILTGYREYSSYDGSESNPGLTILGTCAALLGLALLVYMFGRALRYIFSGE